MRIKHFTGIALLALDFLSCNNQTEVTKTVYNWPTNIQPPTAEIKPTELSAHGEKRIDNLLLDERLFQKRTR
jgi:hypothetical protein